MAARPAVNEIMVVQKLGILSLTNCRCVACENHRLRPGRPILLMVLLYRANDRSLTI